MKHQGSYTWEEAVDAAIDNAKKCESHVKKQIKLTYADMVVRDMPVREFLQHYG